MVETASAVCFDEKLLSRYGGRGPRYTSYPTAAQFTADFTADDYRQNAIASNDSGKPLSLYVHIPFCRSLCYYCACNKIVTRNVSRVQSYLRALHKEIELQAALFDQGRNVGQLHFGGGTPTYLDQRELVELMGWLSEAFSLEQGGGREFSIEVDPRTVDREAIALLGDLGFNRLSLGVQDFDARVQKAVNRVQTVDDVDRLLAAARQGNFNSVSFDLIYGLPQQTVESFDRTLDTVIAMRPDRIATYNYAHLPQRFKGQRMISEAHLPAPQVKLQIFHNTIDRLSAAGYEYIGMDHFALPNDDLVVARQSGTLQRNFQGYSTHGNCELIGLGVSAIGSIGSAYSQNATSTIEYEAMLGAGRLPVKRGINVDADDQLRAQIIQSLMCYDVLDLQAFSDRNNVDFRSCFAEELRRLGPLEQDGLIKTGAGSIRVTSKGRLLLRSIAMVFDRYLAAEQDPGRYSKAI
ncbi:MAG: oxygen-independent coproporphyrinogen III oxidase [Woeseiaceae bacterium]|nr:oxygen-independent coproporphyrinogen III oxidase [Woeseiaceae bacterium]